MPTYRADCSSEQCPVSAADTTEEEGVPSFNDSLFASGPSETSHDVDKQERIERYVRMTIQNQAETRLARSNTDTVSLPYPPAILNTVTRVSYSYSLMKIHTVLCCPLLVLILKHIQYKQALLLVSIPPQVVS